jgi:hypothetical protein
MTGQFHILFLFPCICLSLIRFNISVHLLLYLPSGVFLFKRRKQINKETRLQISLHTSSPFLRYVREVVAVLKVVISKIVIGTQKLSTRQYVRTVCKQRHTVPIKAAAGPKPFKRFAALYLFMYGQPFLKGERMNMWSCITLGRVDIIRKKFFRDIKSR